ncbi:hypothetical protein V5O48_007481 [Marasmius crinis-equi]|uniref:Uncharacterized protein n=1 Tax=Marasmius crinis-equi TaxID=585013 RepID=A0ABR3FGJ0_9AGAR
MVARAMRRRIKGPATTISTAFAMFSLPNANSFVVLNLDPVATVEHLDNPELTEACKKLDTRRYVAYVGDRCQPFFLKSEPYHSYEFFFVYQGLKPVGDSQGQQTDPSWCLPVLPNTSHPLSREPAEPTRPLPWADCFISPFVCTEARCRTFACEEKPASVNEFTHAERVRVGQVMDADIETHRSKFSPSELDLLDAADIQSDDESVYYNASSRDLNSTAEDSFDYTPSCHEKDLVEVVAVKEERVSSEHPEGGPEAECKQEDSTTADVPLADFQHLLPIVGEDSCNLLEEVIMELDRRKEAGKDDIPQQSALALHPSQIQLYDPAMINRPVVKVSFDLNEAGVELNDPADFFREVAALKQLKTEFETRRRQREIEEARRVDEEYFANMLSVPEVESIRRRIRAKSSKLFSKAKEGFKAVLAKMLCL